MMLIRHKYKNRLDPVPVQVPVPRPDPDPDPDPEKRQEKKYTDSSFFAHVPLTHTHDKLD